MSCAIAENADEVSYATEFGDRGEKMGWLLGKNVDVF